MGLKEAVLDVADLAEEEARAIDDPDFDRVLRLISRMLRSAVKAAEHEPAPSSQILQFPNAAAQHATMIEQARAEFRKGKAQESTEPRIIQMIGGVGDGDWLPCDPSIPVGARTNYQGTVYKLEADGKLHAEDEPSTEP